MHTWSKIACAAIAFAALSVTAPAHAEQLNVSVYPKAEALVPQNIKARGFLTVASDASYAPYEYFAPDNKTMIGYDVDVSNAIGAALGLKVKHVNVSFNSILPGLAAGRYDFAISGFNITPEREKVVDFVGPYDEGGSGLAVPIGNPHKLTLKDPLTLCGRPIGGETATSQLITILPKFSAECVKAGKPPITVRAFTSQTEAALALVSGRVDAIISGAAALGYQANLSHGKYEIVAGLNYDPLPVGIALSKGSLLTPAVKLALQHLKTIGVVGLLLGKWHMPAGWLPVAQR